MTAPKKRAVGRPPQHTPAPLILIDAFRARLKQLGNRPSETVAKAERALDRAMSHYEHVKR
jgi:hypothetical protein